MILVGAVTWASWPSYCPVELKLIAVESTEFVDESGNMLSLLSLSVHNSSSLRLRFQAVPTTFQSRIANHWVQSPNRWNRGSLGPNETADEVFLIAPNAGECRFRLKWAYDPKPYPFGIGNPWARFNPPSRMSAAAQAGIKRLSLSLYNSLWPLQPTGGFYRKPHWRAGWTQSCRLNSTGEPLLPN